MNTAETPLPPSEIRAAAAVLPSLLHADTAVINFAAQKDGRLRLRSSSWGDDYKVVHEGEMVEVRWGPQGVELRIVPRLANLGEMMDAISRADDPYDGDPALAARLRAKFDTHFNAMVCRPPRGV